MSSGRTTTALNLRSQPNTTSAVVTILPAFASLDIQGKQGSWYQVSTNGQQGFVHEDFVTLDVSTASSGATTPPGAKGRTTTSINLRMGPGQQFAVRRLLRTGTAVNLLEQWGTWYKVDVNGQQGFVSAEFIALEDGPNETPDKTTMPVPTNTKTGRTIDILNLRAGPSTADRILVELPYNTKVTILDTEGVWFKVTANRQEGYVHSGFIQLDDENAGGGFIDRGGDGELPDLENTPHAPADSDKILISSSMTNSDKLIANTWNRFGGLFAALASRLGIDPGVAVAVFVAESGGDAFRNGRMVIRFENHIFWSKWGQFNPDKFNQHFQYSSRMIWQGHKWRPTASGEFMSFHGNQDTEWDAFTFATTLDEVAAKLSISMGAPQIMGFNHHTVGFESVLQMFDAFSSSEANQIIGFFDFVKGPGTDERKMTALKRLDFETFASLYNGPGQASRYGAIIQALYDGFVRLRMK